MWNHLFSVEMFESSMKLFDEKLLFNDDMFPANLLESHKNYVVGIYVGLGHLSEKV